MNTDNKGLKDFTTTYVPSDEPFEGFKFKSDSDQLKINRWYHLVLKDSWFYIFTNSNCEHFVEANFTEEQQGLSYRFYNRLKTAKSKVDILLEFTCESEFKKEFFCFNEIFDIEQIKFLNNRMIENYILHDLKLSNEQKKFINQHSNTSLL